MKRIISILILSVIFIVHIFGQTTEVNTININLKNGNILSIPLSEIESVKHNATGGVSFTTLSENLNYDASEISSINFTSQEKHSYFYLSEEDLEEWYEGVVDSNGCFLAYRQEADGGYFAIIGDGKNLESAITLKFDSEFNIESMFSNRGFMSVFVDKETKKSYYIISSDGKFSVKEIDPKYGSESKVKRVNSSNAVAALNTIFEWVNNAMTVNDIMNLLSNGSDYLSGFLGGIGLTSSIWGYGKLGNLSLSLFLNWAENKYENDYYRLLTDYMGGGNIYISDINEENIPQYNIEATIYGLNPIGKPLGCSIHTGIAVKLNDSHVFFDDCDLILNNHEVNSDTKYTTSLDATKDITYYLRPYLVVMMDGMLTQTPYTRPLYLWGGKPQPLVIYGDVNNIYFNPNITPMTGDYSNITENSATVECTFGKLPKGAVCGVKYSSDGETYSFKSGSSHIENAQQISLSGLKPMTSYTYYAYVEYAGEPYNGKSRHFTTNSSFGDIYIRSWYDVPGGHGYNWGLNLYDDGTASQVNHGQGQYYYYYRGTWSGNENSITVTISDPGWLGSTILIYTGTVDDPKNPTKLTGTKTIQYKDGDSSTYPFTLYP